ncbi:MAG: hypothetical protein ABW217_03190 [Polyangiaceae bacterium]
MRGFWLLGVALAATSFVAGDAHALNCGPPPSQLLWSYPDAATEVVPTDAVFRAFGAAGYSTRLVFELDGREVPSSASELDVDLSSFDEAMLDNPGFLDVLRRVDYPRESAEFVPPEPLAPGEHEIVIRVLGYLESGSFEPMETHRFTVRAEEQTPPTSDVAISAVTLYTWNDRWGQPRDGEYPPPDALDGACEMPSAFSCDYGLGYWGPPGPDLIASGPATRVEMPRDKAFGTRIDVAATGPALGYLIGSEFVPAGCSAVLGGDTGVALDGDSPPSTVAYYAQAVLPTGLGEAHGFTGEVPIIEGVGTPPVYDFQDNSGWCSLAAVGAHENGSELAALALFFTGGALLRRSRRVRQSSPRA